MNQRTALHLAVTLASLVLAFFALSTSIDNDFTEDDVALLLQAQTAQSEPAHLENNWWGGGQRPVAQYFLAWEYGLAGSDGLLYRLIQILLHAVNAALVFALFRYPTGTPVAATSAMLFALGFGFYGTTVNTVHNIDQVLALTGVLGAGVAAAHAQLYRTPQRRFASMLLAALLFLLALACNELAVMGLVVIGGLMWPNRRTVFSVLRKLGLLVVGAVVWIAVQWSQPSQGPWNTTSPEAWLWMPWRTLQLGTWMLVPLDSSLLASNAPALGQHLVGLLEQTRPAYSLVVGACMGWWFWRGSGALRWLIASWLAFLVPVTLWAGEGSGIEARDVYLAAPFFSGLLAYALRRLWLQTEGMGRTLTAALLLVSLVAELLLVRLVEARMEERAHTPQARAAQQILRRQSAPEPPAEPDVRTGARRDQKSVPMATLEARWVSCSWGSSSQAQSTFRTKAPRLMRPPTP